MWQRLICPSKQHCRDCTLFNCSTLICSPFVSSPCWSNFIGAQNQIFLCFLSFSFFFLGIPYWLRLSYSGLKNQETRQHLHLSGGSFLSIVGEETPQNLRQIYHSAIGLRSSRPLASTLMPTSPPNDNVSIFTKGK